MEMQSVLVANFLQAHREILQSSLHQWKNKITKGESKREQGQMFFQSFKKK